MIATHPRCTHGTGLNRCLLALGLCLGISAKAAPWVPLAEDHFGGAGTHLGASFALRTISGSPGRTVVRLFVGAPYQAAGALAEAGAVLVYVPGPGGWVLDATLRAPTPQAGSHFGASIATGGGSQLVVGAPDYNDVGGIGVGAGRVYFFQDTNVAVTNIVLIKSIIGNGGNFGSAVAVDDDMAVVARVNAGGGNGCVSGYQYDASTPPATWRNLPANGNTKCGVSGAALGSSIAIRRTGDSSYLMVAGAPGEMQAGQALAGAAHVYLPNPDTTAGGFLEVGTLAASNPAFLDVFGASVGIDANHVYVGGTGRDNGVGRVGSVSIFKPGPVSGYEILDEYFPSPPATIGGHCGASLSVDKYNDQFILGCPDSTGSVANEGTARVYRKFLFVGQPVWAESVLSFLNQSHGADRLGLSVGISGDRAFAGAPDGKLPAQAGNGRWKEFSPDVLFRDGFE